MTTVRVPHEAGWFIVHKDDETIADWRTFHTYEAADNIRRRRVYADRLRVVYSDRYQPTEDK